jgi:hypothetical protein
MMLTILANADEKGQLHQIAKDVAELLPESPDRALAVLDFLREMITTPSADPVSLFVLGFAAVA